jgi:hypothetical protein
VTLVKGRVGTASGVIPEIGYIRVVDPIVEEPESDDEDNEAADEDIRSNDPDPWDQGNFGHRAGVWIEEIVDVDPDEVD